MLNISLLILIFAALGYLVYLAIRSLRKYLASSPVREENKQNTQSLGKVIKRHRTECKMTQEFGGRRPGREPSGRLQVGEWKI